MLQHIVPHSTDHSAAFDRPQPGEGATLMAAQCCLHSAVDICRIGNGLLGDLLARGGILDPYASGATIDELAVHVVLPVLPHVNRHRFPASSIAVIPAQSARSERRDWGRARGAPGDNRDC